MEDARRRLGRAIERGNGPGIIIGGPGTGKSLLLQVLASQYHERFDVVLPACARLCTRRALLQAILFELGLPYRVRDEGDLRLSLLDHLLSREECPTGLLLLVDEAQTLSTSLLDELRVLTNLVRGGSPRVRLVLAGSSVLEECFAHPDLESFSQRLSARCYLGPFSREETSQFVRAQIAACGVAPDSLFTADAWEAIFDATDGVPRIVNQLCDRALVDANAAGRSHIDRQIIQSAWADIQQLPTPWDTPAPTTAPSAPLQVVEFGCLSESFTKDSSSVSVAEEDVLIVQRSNDEDLLNIEPTELDEIDDKLDSAPPSVVVSSIRTTTTVVNSRSSDPFAEAFDEEEVVLDSFAKWDDMFRRDAPRVQNRRDPEFAALVQSAISANDVSESVASAAADAALQMMEEDAHEVDAAELSVSPTESPTDDRAKTSPPLRLAVVTELNPSHVHQDFDQLEREAPIPARLSSKQGRDSTPVWSRRDFPGRDRSSEDSLAVDEDPVLIVEDDQPIKTAPVRREEYRNLFSRLRSG